MEDVEKSDKTYEEINMIHKKTTLLPQIFANIMKMRLYSAVNLSILLAGEEVYK